MFVFLVTLGKDITAERVVATIIIVVVLFIGVGVLVLACWTTTLPSGSERNESDRERGEYREVPMESSGHGDPSGRGYRDEPTRRTPQTPFEIGDSRSPGHIRDDDDEPHAQPVNSPAAEADDVDNGDDRSDGDGESLVSSASLPRPQPNREVPVDASAVGPVERETDSGFGSQDIERGSPQFVIPHMVGLIICCTQQPPVLLGQADGYICHLGFAKNFLCHTIHRSFPYVSSNSIIFML